MTNGFGDIIGVIGSDLSERDIEDLQARWITPEAAAAAYLRQVSSVIGSQIVGRNGGGDYAGILIPYIIPGENRVREYRLRRYRPDLEYDASGQPRERAKYLSPPGRGNMLYIPVGATVEMLSDAGLTVLLVEGELKTIAAWRLARHESDRPRFLPLGLAGVYNWRGVVGKTTGPAGDRRNVKGPIPDLDRITWTGRKVIIAFDSDIAEKEQVNHARLALKKELRSRGAEVGFLDWSPSKGKGLDDWLAVVGPGEVLGAIAHVPFDDGEKLDEISAAELAELIIGRYRFAKDAGGKLYVYRDGCYRPKGEALIAQQVKLVLDRLGLIGKWSSRKSEETIKFIAVDAPVLWSAPPADIVNVANGLLKLKTGELLPHTPEFLSAVQLPARFDASARCPESEKFVADCFPADAARLAWQIFAWVMTPDSSIQKAILLLGEGSNGKSVFLTLLLAFIGAVNASAISLHRLESDRFAAARLVGKLANICPDLPGDDLQSTSIFKAITGGDELLAENKFHESFEFRPFAKLIFSANYPPRSKDSSPAFFRRWLVIPFTRRFAADDKETRRRAELDAALATESELSGVLNHAIKAWRDLQHSGFSECESTRMAEEELREATDPLSVFLDRMTVQDPEGVVPTGRLLQAYNQDAAASGRPAMTKSAFGAAFRRQRSGCEVKQRTVNASLCWCYVGLRLLEQGNA